MADIPATERSKRNIKLTADFFGDIGIEVNDEKQARKDTWDFLYRYMDENEVDSTEDLNYNVAAETYLDELSVKFKNVAHSELPGWYLSLCTVGLRDRPLAVASINGVLRRQITTVARRHPRFKRFGENRLTGEAPEASDVPSNSEDRRADTPASEFEPENDTEPVNLHRGTKRDRKPVQTALHNSAIQSRIPAGSPSNSPQDVAIAAPRMVRDLLDHNVRGLREASGDSDEGSEDDMVVLHPKKRLARQTTAGSDANVSCQIGDRVIVMSRERDTYEIPDSPELGPAPLVRVADKSTTLPPPPWIDPNYRPQPVSGTMANKEVNERSPGLDHHDVDIYKQPTVRPSPASSRTDGPSVLLYVLENAIEIAELRAQLEQGQQKDYSKQRQSVQAAVPASTLRKILGLVKE